LLLLLTVAACLQLLEILENSWNLKLLLEILEISWTLVTLDLYTPWVGGGVGWTSLAGWRCGRVSSYVDHLLSAGWTPLHEACCRASMDAARHLLAGGAAVCLVTLTTC